MEVAQDRTETMKGTPPIKIGTVVQNRGVMDFLSEGEGAEEDHPRIRTWKMMMGHLGVSVGEEGPGVTQDPGDQKDLGDPQGRWDPGERPGHCLPQAWEDTVLQSPNVSMIAVENSLQYVGESLSRLMLTQQNVNRNMVDHLNLTAEAQDVQTHVLNKLVENTRQQEFDKLFNAIPIYDGEDPDKFKPWLTQLENACIVGKRDVREVAICSCMGPVLEVISSIDPTEPWSVHRDELRRCFFPE